jgi:hypothetical protein
LKGCLKDDCEHTLLTYATPWAAVTVGADDLYWLSNSVMTAVLTCPNTGCVGAPRTLFRDPNAISQIASADGDYYYWSSSFDIYRCPSGGCAATPEVVARGETAAGYLIFQGAYAYWSEDIPSDAGSQTNDVRVMRAPKDGSAAPQQILRPENSVGDFAVNSKNIYWFDSQMHILSCPLEGCGDSAPAELVSTDEQKFSLHADESGLYWLVMVHAGGYFGGALHFCAFDRCPMGESITVIDKQVNEYAFNGPFVYWTPVSPTGAAGETIERVAKPSGS